MASTPKEDREHLQRLQRYRQAVDRIFTAATKDAAAIGHNLKGVNTDKVFSFADYPTAKKAADALIKQLRDDLAKTIESAVDDEWALSNSKNDRIVKGAYGAERWAALSAGRQESLTQANAQALQSFKARTVAGLTLSERVWKYSSRFKDEIELGLDCGIRDGLSAAAMARQLKQYLQEPDKLFRRVRNERGALVLSKRAAAYHPGQGVYRSSYKNALRLAATESNMAYRTADHERWKQLDFVVGVEIRLSNNHTLNGKPFVDICDELAGRYPKEFKFTGWHPLCRCFAVSILKTDDEIDRDERLILAGKEPSGASVRRVDDVPDAFKAWVEANRERIEGASSLPYFIRDNRGLVDGILNPKPSILERAAARHAARTPEEIADIKERWAERAQYNEATKQAAADALAQAKDFAEVDYSLLQQYADKGDIAGMAKETAAVLQRVEAMKAEEQALGTIIPNVHDWHKKFTLTELQAVDAAVKKKLAQLSGLDLPKLKEKLEFEITFVTNPAQYGKKQYSTWEVAADAYKAQAIKVQYQIDVQAATASLAPVEKFSAAHKRMTKLSSLLQEAKAAINAGEPIAEIKKKVDAALKEYNAKLAKEKKTADAYSQERKDNAMWAQSTAEADARLRDRCGEVWRSATRQEKAACFGYTEEFHNINEPLRGLTYYGSAAKAARGLKRIDPITRVISRSTYDFDMWVQRGDGLIGLEKFGVSANASDAEIMGLVGKTGTEGAFWSAGVAKGRGFSSRPVIFNIYMPRGTQALYCEPFSAYGRGAKSASWDGVNKQASFGQESEILIQRGTTFRVTKVEKVGGAWYIDVDVIAQNYLPYPYTGGFPY